MERRKKVNRRLEDKEKLAIFFYDNVKKELRETQGKCRYLEELLTNYEKEYGELSEDCFIIGEFDTTGILEEERGYVIKNPMRLELNLDLDFDLNSLIKENPCLRFADFRQVRISNLLEVLRNTLTFYRNGLYREMQYDGIKEYVTQKQDSLNSEDKSKIVQIMQNEIYNSILEKNLQELRKQNRALERYEKYIGARYKVLDLEKGQRKLYDLKDPLEIQFEDGTKMVRTIEWMLENPKAINAKIELENQKALLIEGIYYRKD